MNELHLDDKTVKALDVLSRLGAEKNHFSLFLVLEQCMALLSMENLQVNIYIDLQIQQPNAASMQD